MEPKNMNPNRVILEMNNRLEAFLLFAPDDGSEWGVVSGQTAPPAGSLTHCGSGVPPDPARSALGSYAVSRLPALIRQKRR